VAQSANSLAATQWWVTPSANGPSVDYLVWAEALEIEPGEFIRRLTYYYDQ